MVQVPNASAFLVILLSVIATIVAIPAQATEEADPRQTLAKTRSLKCTFETAMQGDWKDGRLLISGLFAQTSRLLRLSHQSRS